MSEIYKMDLHSTIKVEVGHIEYLIVRVHGGWIYNHVRLDSGQMNATFVPFDESLQAEGEDLEKRLQASNSNLGIAENENSQLQAENGQLRKWKKDVIEAYRNSASSKLHQLLNQSK